MQHEQDLDRTFMQRALQLADEAERQAEVPVGAVVVMDGVIIGEGFNRVISNADPGAHAEMLALRAAGNSSGNYRLPGASLYVTLEPCCMCAGAIIHARISRLIFAADDPKTGAAGSCFDLLADKRHNHQVQISRGCMARESANKLHAFFLLRR